MTTVTVLNGPPGCGKDTLAKLIAERTGAHHGEFKEALYIETAKYFKTYLERFKRNATDRFLKEKPIYDTHLGLMSPREMLIHVSEKHIKPNFGTDYFGITAAENWLDISTPIIVSDGGFGPEVQALCDIYDSTHVMVIRLVRDGYTFEGDSRRYISEHHVDCNVFEVVLQDGEIESAYNQIQALREEFFKHA